MLKTRVITAVIGFIIALGAITLGGLTYDILITLLALIGWREFILLSKAKHYRYHDILVVWQLYSKYGLLCIRHYFQLSNVYIW